MMTPFVFVFETATFFARRIDNGRKKRKEQKEQQYYGTTPASRPNFLISACKFCNSPFEQGTVFCPGCNRSVR
jgi:hypothetical protein